MKDTRQGLLSEASGSRKELASTQKDRIRYGKPQGDKFEICTQGRLPSISATVDLGNTSMKQKKVLKAGSISALKRCGNYDNSLSSVKINLVWVRVPSPPPILFIQSELKPPVPFIWRCSSIGRAICVENKC